MKKKIITNKNKGILFWITGLSGSGKTTISKKISEANVDKYHNHQIESTNIPFALVV